MAPPLSFSKTQSDTTNQVKLTGNLYSNYPIQNQPSASFKITQGQTSSNPTQFGDNYGKAKNFGRPDEDEPSSLSKNK